MSDSHIAADPPHHVLFRNVDVVGRGLTHVRVQGARIVEVGDPTTQHADEIVEGTGNALIPGLHDHHLHVLALAASYDSVDCSQSLDPLARARPDRSGWIRGTGYHESTAGTLTRRVLDRLRADVPVRVQHHSGAVWHLNTRALEEVAHLLAHGDDVERDDDGVPTGRLWRFDRRLQDAVPSTTPDVARVGRELARLGVTGVTDATPNLSHDTADLLATAARSGTLPQRLCLLGSPPGWRSVGVAIGPCKIVLPDHRLPSLDDLVHDITEARMGDSAGRPVALHAVSREALILAVAALHEVGIVPGDRIEHASLVPVPDLLHGLHVVTQPGFIADRGDRYLREVAPEDVGDLYRYATLQQHGVRVWPSSDAPYGPLSPWEVASAAAQRRTPGGSVLGSEERVSPDVVLADYWRDWNGSQRTVAPGQRADLVLLDSPWAEVLRRPRSVVPRGTWIRGLRCA